MVDIPAKYARSKGANFSKCSPINRAKSPAAKDFKLSPLQKYLIAGVAAWVALFTVIHIGHRYRCFNADDLSITEVKQCVAAFGPPTLISTGPMKGVTSGLLPAPL